MTPDDGAMPPRRDPGGDGPNPALAAALNAHANGAGGPADVHSALAASRLLIPVVEDESGPHLTSATVTGDDGSPAMLAFTSEAALRRWDSRARPIPVPTRSAAEAALANGAGSMMIDVAGPVSFAVDAPGLRSLASGWREHGAWPAAGHVPVPREGEREGDDERGDEGDGQGEVAVDVAFGAEPASGDVAAAERAPNRDDPRAGSPPSLRDLVVRRIVPTTMAVASRVWGALHQRVLRIGTR